MPTFHQTTTCVLAGGLGQRVVGTATMTHTFHSFYPALLAVIDLAIAGGLLCLQSVSPLGLLMAAVGVLLVRHVVLTVMSRTDSAVHRCAKGLKG